MLTTRELLDRLRDKGVRNADIARTLGVTPSRVTEMYNGERAIKLDEAAKLVQAFELEQPQSQRVSPLPAPVSRLIVQHIALALNADAPEEIVASLAEDVRAFAEFVADPTVRESIEAAELFFRAMSLRRSEPGEEVRPESDPARTN